MKISDRNIVSTETANHGVQRVSGRAGRTPVILVLSEYYSPGFKGGGVLRTIEKMVEHFGSQFHFRIVTRDRDFRDVKPYPEIWTNHWLPLGQAEVLYLSPEGTGFQGLRRVINQTPHDVLYLCSFFSPRFAIIPLVLRRLRLIDSPSTILAPHGELLPGALQTRRLKKRMHLHLSRAIGLCRNISWRASTSAEAADLQKLFGSCIRLHIARDLPTVAEIQSGAGVERTKRPGHLRLVFLSRISRKKNLAWLLRLLGEVKGSIDFHIYGFLDEMAYWEECQKLVRELPSNISVHWHGGIPPNEVVPALQKHHLFVLPSLDENYGHVVLEAMSAGCMVLLSDRTPWRGLNDLGIGWDLPLDQPKAFSAVLHRCVEMTEVEFKEMSMRTRQFATAHIADGVAIEQNRALLEMAVQENL